MIRTRLIKKLKAADGEFTLDISFSSEPHQIIAIYGPSGAGKTSILRMIAGLLTPDAGFLRVNDKDWYASEKGFLLPPGDRNVGFVFQDYALFPNMSVLENIQFAVPPHGDRTRAEQLIAHFDLDELRNSPPHTLSGGQQQRVAVARALAQQPDLLCLDEPLSALDHTLRVKLQDFILEEHKKRPFTILMVSHDLAEIFKMSDTVLHVQNGRVLDFNTPEVVFSDSSISGKFQFTGKIISVEKGGIMNIITVLIDQQMVKVVVDPREIDSFSEGDQVLVASKAFNPIIRKIL